MSDRSSTADKQSLADYVSARNSKRRWLETIPEFDEVVTAYQAGVKVSTIRRWLKDVCGYSGATRHNVDTYLREHYGTSIA